MKNNRLRIAIQKKGRLFNDSMELLKDCGFKVRIQENALFSKCENLPIDLLFVRDDDISTLVADGICDLGIIGENVLQEYQLELQAKGNKIKIEVIKKLGFSKCHLGIAINKEEEYVDIQQLKNQRIATSYPNLLQKFLVDNNIDASILTISGSVEIAPRLNMADAICDLISTGKTLEDNNLKEIRTVMNSQAVLIMNRVNLLPEKQSIIDLLLRRINGVLQAQESKYIMFHAPKQAIQLIKEILPGSETPTIMSLQDHEEKVAVHLVSREAVFWDTLEKLKGIGASSILVLPIEKMMV